jgi:hypothetical protein
MGFNLYELGVPYSMWTLIVAIAVPLIAAVATFACMHRARTARKLVTYFVITPIYFVLVAFLLSDTSSLLSGALKAIGISYPHIAGFLLAISLSVIYLSLISLICGAGIMHKRGAITNALFTLIIFPSELYLTYRTWLALTMTDVAPVHTATAAQALPILNKLSFLPSAITSLGIEIYALAVFALYLLVFFLTFIAVKSREEIERSEFERRHRDALRKGGKKKSGKNTDEEKEAEEPVCARCQFARKLLTEKGQMICDKRGVVSTTHSCKDYIYDPLKRIPARPSFTAPDFSESLEAVFDAPTGTPDAEPKVAPDASAFQETEQQPLAPATNSNE